MATEIYSAQLALLVRAIPEIAREDSFALTKMSQVAVRSRDCLAVFRPLSGHAAGLQAYLKAAARSYV